MVINYQLSHSSPYQSKTAQARQTHPIPHCLKTLPPAIERLSRCFCLMRSSLWKFSISAASPNRSVLSYRSDAKRKTLAQILIEARSVSTTLDHRLDIHRTDIRSFHSSAAHHLTSSSPTSGVHANMAATQSDLKLENVLANSPSAYVCFRS